MQRLVFFVSALALSCSSGDRPSSIDDSTRLDAAAGDAPTTGQSARSDATETTAAELDASVVDEDDASLDNREADAAGDESNPTSASSTNNDSSDESSPTHGARGDDAGDGGSGRTVQDASVDAGDAEDSSPTGAETTDPPLPEASLVRIQSANVLGTVAFEEATCTYQNACTQWVEHGATVEFTASSNPRMQFSRWVVESGPAVDCDTASCSLQVSGPVTIRAEFDSPHNLAFFTEQRFNGDLGGLAGADASCALEAEAAGLSGEFRAWLSASSEDAAERFASVTGWVRMDGHPVAAGADDLAAGRVLMPIAFSATGRREWTSVWSATAGDGSFGGDRTGYDEGMSVAPGSCNDWTSDLARDPNDDSSLFATAGSSAHAGALFTDASLLSCDQTAPLFCLGTDKTTPPPLPDSSARLAFVSHGAFDASAGLSAADALCNEEAAGAGLSGTFRAMLGTSGGSAASRLDLTGAGWNRVDGVPFVEHAADLADESQYLTALNVEADGTRVASTDFYDSYAYTGGGFGMKPESGQTCQDWSDDSQDGFVILGNPQGAYENAAACCSSGCNHTRRIFCFQE